MKGFLGKGLFCVLMLLFDAASTPKCFKKYKAEEGYLDIIRL